MTWQHLEPRPNEGHGQLFIRGTRVRAYSVYLAKVASGISLKEVADDKFISEEAANEAILYSIQNREWLDKITRDSYERIRAKGY